MTTSGLGPVCRFAVRAGLSRPIGQPCPARPEEAWTAAITLPLATYSLPSGVSNGATATPKVLMLVAAASLSARAVRVARRAMPRKVCQHADHLLKRKHLTGTNIHSATGLPMSQEQFIG